MIELRWVLKNLKGSVARYVVSLILIAITAASVFITPVITRYIVNNIVIGVKNPTTGEVIRDTAMLLPMLGIWIGFVLIKTLINEIRVYYAETSTQRLLNTIRVSLFENMQKQEGEFFDQNRAGDIMTRFTGDLDLIRYTAAWTLPQIINTLVLFATVIVFFFTTNWIVTLSLLAMLPVMFVVSRRFSKEMRPHYVRNREKLSELNGIVQENISANKVVRAFAREDYEIDKFSEANQAYLDSNLTTNRAWLSIWPIPEFLAQFMTVVVLVLGGVLTIYGKMNVGDLAAFMASIWALSYSVRNIGNFLNDFQRFFPSAEKVMTFYYSRPRIFSKPNAIVPSTRLNGDVVFEDVCLQFNGKEIIKHVSFHVPAGKTIGIVGETGSGKTTLINLLTRFYDVSSGKITVDGVDVRDYNLQSLRKNIGVTTQDVFLFSDTIEGNVAFGNPGLEDEKVLDYAARSGASDFIVTMSESYDTIIGERGVGLSGGQRQRIALARALAIEPAILILDDTTSAVDMKTERYIWEQLQTLPFTCSKIIIAQRISTISEADMILVMQDGCITASGTHEELLVTSDFYREVYEMQSQQTE